jgi:hypothetical protein
MPNTLKLAPDLYTNPGKTSIPGARVDFRKISLLTTDLITTQLIALGVLPAGHRLMGAFIETASLDAHTTTTITVTVGVLNSYYNQMPAGGAGSSLPVATYNSGGTTDLTSTDPELVTGQNIITASTIVRAGGRVDTFPLAFSTAIGIDTTKDRIIAVAFPALPATAAAGVFGLGLVIDEP